MQMSRIAVLLFGTALLFSSAALAGEANRGKLQLSDKVVVDGQPLNPGNYRVEWDGSGPNVQVRLVLGKQTVATLPAHLAEQLTANSQDAYSTSVEHDGSRALTTIYFSGKRFALQIDHEASPQASN